METRELQLSTTLMLPALKSLSSWEHAGKYPVTGGTDVAAGSLSPDHFSHWRSMEIMAVVLQVTIYQ